MTVETIIIVIVFLLMCSAYSPSESHIGLNFFSQLGKLLALTTSSYVLVVKWLEETISTRKIL
jgi:hypothetical protein